MRAPVIGRLALTCATTPASVDGPARTVRGRAGRRSPGGGDGRPGAPPGRRPARPAGSRPGAAAASLIRVKPVGVLGVRGRARRDAARRRGAGPGAASSASWPGVASVKVTRAVTVRMPPPSLTSASNGARVRVAMTCAAHREDDAADHQAGDDGPEGAIDAAGGAVARHRRGDRARDGREDGRAVAGAPELFPLPGRRRCLRPRPGPCRCRWCRARSARR